MEKLSQEEFDLRLKGAGLRLPPQTLERLKYLVEQYQDRLKTLHSVDLGEEEVAGIFPPQWE